LLKIKYWFESLTMNMANLMFCILQDFANIPGLQVTAPITQMGAQGGNQQVGFGRQPR
jgi:hypothetical protein